MVILSLLGGNPFIGGTLTVLAGIASIAWEYMRLESGGRWLAYVVTAKKIAITLAIISIILMVSRFIAVASNQ